MQKRGGEVLYSASDIVDVLECEHLTSRDLINLDTPLPKTEDNDRAKLIRPKGHAHENRLVAHLKAQHQAFADIGAMGEDLSEPLATGGFAPRRLPRGRGLTTGHEEISRAFNGKVQRESGRMSPSVAGVQYVTGTRTTSLDNDIQSSGRLCYRFR